MVYEARMMEAKLRGERRGEIKLSADLVNEKRLSLAGAVERLNMSVEDFVAKAAEYGHPIRS